MGRPCGSSERHGDGGAAIETQRGSTGLDSPGYERAKSLLHRCATGNGFVATPHGVGNYSRVWARDGVIQSLAALMTDDKDLVAAARSTFETFAEHRGPHGEIPSNVDVGSHRVSYGGTAGRVDADLWFLLGCGEYWAATGDAGFLENIRPVMDEVLFLVGAWEFNDRGLVYVPLTGDWADEYLQHGYVLYDQLLYLQAMRAVCAARAETDGSADHGLVDRTHRLGHLIRANYWIEEGDRIEEDFYHPTLARQGEQAAARREGMYWMPSFSPTGYGYRFDAFANVLVSLLGVAGDGQRADVDGFMASILDDELPLLPAFHPVIDPVDDAWHDLQMTFQYTFRNHPNEYQNGGRWPMIGGFHVAERAARGDEAEARRLLAAVHAANALGDDDGTGFPEFVHGDRIRPGGTTDLGWSAAGAVIGEQALAGKPVVRIGGTTD